MHKLAMKSLLPIMLLSMLLGCGTTKKEPSYTNEKLKAQKLSEEVLQAMQPNSTEVLKRADEWLRTSEQLLNSATQN